MNLLPLPYSYPEYTGKRLLRNIGTFIPKYTASYYKSATFAFILDLFNDDANSCDNTVYDVK
jgi:hypothetical protein